MTTETLIILLTFDSAEKSIESESREGFRKEV